VINPAVSSSSSRVGDRSTRAARVASLTLCFAFLQSSISAAGDAKPNGQQLYAQHCAACHGATGHGDGPDAALFTHPPADLRGGVMQTAPTNAVVRRVLDGRKLTLALDAQAARARAADVESLVVYLQRLPSIDWRTADAGKEIYSARCAPCHGPYGHPSGAPPPGVRAPRDFADPAFQQTVSKADLIPAVRHGRAGMPALVPRLNETDAAQVAAFVRLLSPGFTTYTQYCATCHGEHGIGSGSFAESSMQPTAIFDRAYFAHHDPEALRSQVWHMLEEHQPSMPHFRGRLSEADVRAIVKYLEQGQSAHH
jgi:mono/diheme cytochrome c family protein